MCGLLFLNLRDNYQFNTNEFQKALDLSSYRGKDDQQIIKHQNNYFGFNRLSIVGSNNSNQPIHDNEKLLIFNGELYNFDNKNFESDTLNLFEFCKTNRITNLDGQYAFILFDKIKKTLRIFRDEFGQKPLYYIHHNNFFIASSTIKSIMSLYKSLTKKELNINREAIEEYLLFGYFREPNTIFSEIKILDAGKCLYLNTNNQITIENYLPKKINNKKIYDDFFIKTLKHSKKIKSLFLSSGIDSNYILTRLIKNNLKFKIYTLRNENSKIDESSIVIKNLKNLKILNNLEIINTKRNNLFIEIKHLAQIYELPSSDGLNLFYLLKNIKKPDISKIFFSGIGGDEIFGGYNTFKYYNLFKILKAFKFPFNFFKKTSRFNKFKNDVYNYYTAYKSDPFFINIISKDNINKITQKIKNSSFKTNSSKNILETIRRLEINEYMKNQLLRDADNISLYFGKEIFNPFISSNLYFNKIDFKKNLKSEIESLGIYLSNKKKGFSIEFENKNINQRDLVTLTKNNEKYKIIDSDIFKEIFKNKNLLKQQIKVSMLLFWLEYNT